MQKKAVIFDMDGVLIDSEPFWQKAQIEVMKDLGVEITEQECEETMGLRIDALVGHWYNKYRWEGPGISETCSTIVNRVAAHVMESGEAKTGVHQALEAIKTKGFLITIEPQPVLITEQASLAYQCNRSIIA